MVIQPRGDLYEAASVFRSTPFCPRFTPQTRVRDALRACSSLRGCRVRGGLAARQCSHCTCRATSEAGLPQLWHACSVLREFPLRRDPNRAAPPSLLRCAWTARRCPSARSPRAWTAAGDRNMPNPTIPNRPASSRCAPPRLPVPPSLAERMPSLAGTAARRPSTQSPKHLAAQPSSASERQDKEAACGPHSGIDSIAHR